MSDWSTGANCSPSIFNAKAPPIGPITSVINLTSLNLLKTFWTTSVSKFNNVLISVNLLKSNLLSSVKGNKGTTSNKAEIIFTKSSLKFTPFTISTYSSVKKDVIFSCKPKWPSLIAVAVPDNANGKISVNRTDSSTNWTILFLNSVLIASGLTIIDDCSSDEKLIILDSNTSSAKPTKLANSLRKFSFALP